MKSLEDVVWARACCDSDQSIEDVSCKNCPYESLNKGGMECERQLVKDEKIYLKKYLNDIQKGEIRKEVKRKPCIYCKYGMFQKCDGSPQDGLCKIDEIENTWEQWKIGGRLGCYVPICGSCGKVIGRDFKFCPYCGAKIKWTKLK